jgi:hypothetical protein
LKNLKWKLKNEVGRRRRRVAREAGALLQQRVLDRRHRNPKPEPATQQVFSGFRLASVALVALPWKILEIRFREGRESGFKSSYRRKRRERRIRFRKSVFMDALPRERGTPTRCWLRRARLRKFQSGRGQPHSMTLRECVGTWRRTPSEGVGRRKFTTRSESPYVVCYKFGSAFASV